MIKAANGIRTRESVWSLLKWDETLLWYARAVKEMRARKLDDPTSWRYQAAIHGYDANEPMLKALAKAGEKHPAKERDVWKQCQHGSWFFLPWHRGYLGCFEAIMLDIIKSLGGPHEDWALPYWNYSDDNDTSARYLRPEFVEATWPDGGDNPLFAGVSRAPYQTVDTILGTAADVGLDDAEVSLRAMNETDFSATGNASSFGGGETGFSFSGDSPGLLEITPHGDVHVAVGQDQSTGQFYWMGRFETAGLDPIFWLHHCNLDRLWTAWVRDPASTGNPSKSKWGKPSSAASGAQMPFFLHHPTVPNYRLNPIDVVDSGKSVFAYHYDDEPGVAAPSPFELAPAEEVAVSKKEPDLVGATSKPVLLEGTRTSATVAVPPAKPSLLEGAPVERTYLSLENIVAEGPPTPYRVYLKKAGGDVEQLVGTMPLFGVHEAARPDSHSGGSGLKYVFDVTDVLKQIGHEKDVEVLFAPKAGSGPVSIKVGKIGFYRG
jgi:tyrosinase